MSAELTLAQVYRRAIEIIDERGWWAHGWMPGGGDPRSCPVCMLAAVGLAIGGTIVTDPLVRGPVFATDAQRALYAAAWDGLRDVLPAMPGIWNDSWAADADEVRDALERAAEEAERRG